MTDQQGPTQPPWPVAQPLTQHRPASLILLQLLTIGHAVWTGCLLIAVTFTFTPNDRSDDTPVLEPLVPVLPSLVVAVLILLLRQLLPPIRPHGSVEPAGSEQRGSAGLLQRQGRRRFLAEVLLENGAAALATVAALSLCFLMRDVGRWQAQLALGSVMLVLLFVVLPTRRRLRAAQRRYERAGAHTGLNEQYR